MNEVVVVDPRNGQSYTIRVPEGFTMPSDPAQRAVVLRRLSDRGLLTPAPAAQTPPDAAPTVPAPGTDIPAVDSGATTPTEGLGDTVQPVAQVSPDFEVDAQGNPILFQGRPSALVRRARTPEEAAAMMPRGIDADMSQVPEGMGVHMPGGITLFPNEGQWASIDRGASEEEQRLQEAALRARVQGADRGGIRGAAYGVASSPEAVGAMMGYSYGLADELLGVADPVAEAALRQQYAQVREENPIRTFGGEAAGMLGQYGTLRSIPGVQQIPMAAERAATTGSLGRRALMGSAIGLPYGMGYGAATAEPGERAQDAFDPVNIGIDAAVGAGLPLAGAGIAAAGRGLANSALGRGVSNIYGAISQFPTERGPIRGLTDALGSFTETSGPYGTTRYQQELEQQQLRDYLQSVNPISDQAERAAVGQAALDLGIDLPRGIVTNPDAYAAAARERPLAARGAVERAEERMQRQLAEQFGQRVTAGGVAPTSPGVAGDRLRQSVMTNLDQQIENLSRQYDEFNLTMQGEFELPQNVSETLDDVFRRRSEAGSESDADARFIGSVANLVRRAGGSDEAGELIGGVTWQGLRDARSELKVQTANFSKGRQLTPAQRDMQTMENALTDAMVDVIRKNAPEGEADKMVERFFDLDRQYAIAQETRREMNDLFSGESTSVMNTLGKALRDGGQSSIDLVNTLKANSAPQDWENTRAVLLHQLGSDNLGQFDPAKFGEAWTKIAPEVRDKVFDRAHLRDLNAIATISRRLPNITKSGAPATMFTSRSLTGLGTGAVSGALLGGPAGAAVGAALATVTRAISARRLVKPYTASKAKDVFRRLDDVAKAQSDAQRTLGLMRLNRELDAFSQHTGVELDPGTTVPTTGANASRRGAQNVTGSVD